MYCRWLNMFLVLFVACLAHAPSHGREVEGVKLGTKNQWVELKLRIAGKNLISALAVDRTNGDIYILPNAGAVHSRRGSQGIWKSTDQGQTFIQMTKDAVTGGGWNSFCIDMDLEKSGRLAVFPMYGHGGMTLDGGKTWQAFAPVKAPHGADYGSVDWSDPKAQTVFCNSHEASPGLNVSLDGGKSWRPLDLPRSSTIGVIGAKTLIQHGGKKWMRSSDGGNTWEAGQGNGPRSKVVRKLKGTFYLLSNGRVMVSKNACQSWKIQGEAAPDVDAWAGPWFGKDENHIFVVGLKGIFETRDGAATWRKAADLPGKLKGKFGNRSRSFRQGPNFGYDPAKDIMYIAMLGVPAYRFERGE